MAERTDVEVERYELAAPPAYRFDLRRRDFFKLFGAGVVVALAAPALAQESGRSRRGEDLPDEVSAWLHVGEDGRVTVYTGKTEVGQNIRTSLTQAVADEMRVDPGSVALVMADTARVPYDMGTFGSRTTPVMAPQLRKAAAAAREALAQLAAERWSVERGSLVMDGGVVAHPATGRRATLGELTRGQKLTRTVAADDAVLPAQEWKTAGTSLRKVNGRDIVTGRHHYTSDLVRPGMVHGKVLRPPRAGATLASLDAGAVGEVTGATLVRDGDFVGVSAPTREAAARALDALRPRWSVTPQPKGTELFDVLRRKAAGGPATVRPRDRDVTGTLEEGLAAAHKRVTATYTVAYIAHVPLEPRAAVAEWSGDSVTVWTGTQRPFGVRTELAEAFRMPEDKVRVVVPDTGSGYGGKHTGEAAIEAARLARAAGRPVKVAWTREEESTWAYFRPAGVIDARSGATADGTLTAWEFHTYNAGAAALRTPYEVAHRAIEFHPADSPLRQGSYRGLAATANTFARESHMDELAHALGLDPLALRLRNLPHPRLRPVLEAAAERFGWGKAKPTPARGFGLACGTEKGSYVASCAEVAISPAGQVKVTRAVTAFECGAIVNPEHLRGQVEGAVVMGLGGALFEEVRFDEGRVLNPRLSSYRVPRFSDVPVLETVLLDRKDLPSAGAGETPIIAIAPAIASAIFSATGVRLRALPLVPQGLPTS